MAGLAAAAAALAGCGLIGSGDPHIDEAVRDDDGVMLHGGDVGVNALRVGDCFDDDGASTDVAEVVAVNAVPCSEPHDNEVFYLGALAEADYPGEDLVDSQVLAECLMVFDAFAGVPFEESMLDIARIFPSEANWSDNDRGYVCIVYDVSRAKLEGSMRGRGY